MSVFGLPPSTLDSFAETSCEPVGTVSGYSCVPGSPPPGDGLPLVALIRLPALTVGAARPQPTPERNPV